MKRIRTIVLLIGILIIIFHVTPQSAGLPSEYQNGSYVTWTVNVAPRNVTNMYYSEGGNMLAENLSTMSCVIDDISGDVTGTYIIGNVSVTANDTEIARDLVLGVWGTPTEWWPGLFIQTGESNIEILNATAFAAAERIAGNYLNGTMMSRYDNVSVVVWNSTSQVYNQIEVECIIFDYEQDPTAFGEPQITHLAYSLTSGVLVKANTSYSFGDPYNLVLTLVELAPPIPVDFTPYLGGFITLAGLIGGAILAIIVIVYVRSSRSN